MTPVLGYGLAGAALFGIGLYGLLVREHLVRKVLAVNIMGNGVFLLLVSLPQRDLEIADPVPRALVLTGIVVAVSATAVALALVRRVHAATGRTYLRGEPEE